MPIILRIFHEICHVSRCLGCRVGRGRTSMGDWAVVGDAGSVGGHRAWLEPMSRGLLGRAVIPFLGGGAPAF